MGDKIRIYDTNGELQEFDPIDAVAAVIPSGGLTITAGGLTVTAGALSVADTASAHSIDGTDLSLPNLPTSDPEVAGQLWANSNVVTVSAGA